MKNRKSFLITVDAILFVVLVFLDQITKYLAITHLKDGTDVVLIDKVFRLHYLENRGAAFGMLQNQKIFFIFIAIVILAAICYVIFRMPNKKKYTAFHILLGIIAAGAVGNMIDRFQFDYVVDFLYFELINFPIFNVADIYVTCATILLAGLLLFYYKEEDLKFLSIRPKKYREVKLQEAESATDKEQKEETATASDEEKA